MKLLALHTLYKHFNFLSKYSNLSSHISTISSVNTPVTETIPTMEITTIQRNNYSSIHVEHFFNIQELKKTGLKLNETLLFCGVRQFFNEPPTIYPELIRTFWRHAKFINKKTIASMVLGVKAVLSYNTIT